MRNTNKYKYNFLILMLIFVTECLTQKSISLSSLNEIKFDLKLLNVDSSSAQFVVQDDNQTTYNYDIFYHLTTLPQKDFRPEHLDSDTISISEKSFQIQTNSLVLLKQQEEILKANNLTLEDLQEDSNDSGEKYNSEEKLLINSKTFEEKHSFFINELESNKYYEVNFTIRARRAHLSLHLLPAQKLDNTETKKEFNFKFKTSFDLTQAALSACSDKTSSSCYVQDSACTVCKASCYLVGSNMSKPVLCEPCPCDTSRSTGECFVVDQPDSAKNRFQPEVIKCKKCIKPYTGLLCNECENEGIEYYKNDRGECVLCNCNNNALLDNQVDPKKRKCQAITGTCIDCMYNTTGKHCDECKPGFEGNALRRTCRPVKQLTSTTTTIVANRTTKSTQTVPTTNHLNEKYSYKTLALFSLYIFCVLFLILLTFLCIKAKYTQDNILKNEANLPQSMCPRIGTFFSGLNESTRPFRSRVAIYLTSICPNGLNKFTRSVNLSSNGANSNGIYNRANNGLNDDDRLNLAEYQVFDDSLLVNDEQQNYIYRANFTDNDELNNSANNNPYRSLTIKS